MFRHISRAELEFWRCTDKAGSFYNVSNAYFYNVCKNVILTTKYSSFAQVQFMFVKYEICLYFLHNRFCMSVGWDVKWWPVSRIHLTTSLARKRPFEEDARDDRCLLIHIPDNSLITRLNHRCGVWWQELQRTLLRRYVDSYGLALQLSTRRITFFLPAHLAVEFWSSWWKFPLSSKRSYWPCS